MVRPKRTMVISRHLISPVCSLIVLSIASIKRTPTTYTSLSEFVGANRDRVIRTTPSRLLYMISSEIYRTRLAEKSTRLLGRITIRLYLWGWIWRRGSQNTRWRKKKVEEASREGEGRQPIYDTCEREPWDVAKLFLHLAHRICTNERERRQEREKEIGNNEETGEKKKLKNCSFCKFFS